VGDFDTAEGRPLAPTNPNTAFDRNRIQGAIAALQRLCSR